MSLFENSKSISSVEISVTADILFILFIPLAMFFFPQEESSRQAHKIKTGITVFFIRHHSSSVTVARQLLTISRLPFRHRISSISSFHIRGF